MTDRPGVRRSRRRSQAVFLAGFLRRFPCCWLGAPRPWLRSVTTLARTRFSLIRKHLHSGSLAKATRFFQWHQRFSAQYSGPDSFKHASEQAASVVLTLYNSPIPIHSGFFAALDCQHIDDPGYNRARGSAVVLSARIHLEFVTCADRFGCHPPLEQAIQGKDHSRRQSFRWQFPAGSC